MKVLDNEKPVLWFFCRMFRFVVGRASFLVRSFFLQEILMCPQITVVKVGVGPNEGAKGRRVHCDSSQAKENGVARTRATESEEPSRGSERSTCPKSFDQNGRRIENREEKAKGVRGK